MAERILVLDDDAIILKFVKLHLENAGFEVRTSTNPLTVAMTLGRFRPDLVLLDVEMPTIRGTEVLAALRRSSCHDQVRICLFSSLAPTVLEQLSREYSAAGWIRKASPLDGLGLVQEVQRFLGEGAKALPKAIVADDSRAMRRLITGVVTGRGYEVTHAGDGPEVLEALDRLDTVDLVLLDINMPEADGAELVRTIRGHRASHGAHVVLVTCESDLQHVRRVQAAGANGHLLKPFTPRELIETIQAAESRRPAAREERGCATG